MISVTAPAKINLTLEALSQRPDGYHDIKSVVQAVSLSDYLEFEPRQELTFRCDDVFWQAEESLVWQAAALLKGATGCGQGAAISIRKNIPLLSGLGGDSSDAAATLIGLNRLWETGLSTAELEKLANRLGSDAGYFLHGGTALMQGRGEIIEPLLPVKPCWVVLLFTQVPRTAGKTGRLYGSLTRGDYTNGRATERLVTIIKQGRPISMNDLFNVFEKAAYREFDGLDGYRRLFLKAGATGVHLAGSGPTLFTLVQNEKQADKIHLNLTKLGLQAAVAKTVAGIE